MKIAKKIVSFMTRNKKILIIGLIIVVIAGYFVFTNKTNPTDIYTLTSDSLVSDGITVGGTVVAQEEVDLAFQLSGRVARVSKDAGSRVSQGEVIASIDTGTLSANVLKAQADLDAEVAKLDEYKTQEGSGFTEVQTQQNQLIREIKNSYVVSEDAVKNKTDQFFTNPQNRLPKIFSLFNDSNLRDKINDERYRIGLVLKAWQTTSNSLSTSNYTNEALVQTKNNIIEIQTYLNLLSAAVNKFEENTLYPQTTIDKYKTDLYAARTNLDSALNNLIKAEESLRSTTSQIPYQEARVKSARATVQNYQAELEKAVIRAPFTGLITKQDAKVGMSAFADQSLVSMISDSNYGLDTYVPEIYIAQIKLGNKAQVTLNSYGATQKFEATVTYIDPAASQRDGTASYKVELVFDQNDERIKSGMTADVEIQIDGVSQAFWIPSTTVIDQGGLTYVKIKSGEATELRKIQVGERTPDKTEVLSGLIVGDQLVIENKK